MSKFITLILKKKMMLSKRHYAFVALPCFRNYSVLLPYIILFIKIISPQKTILGRNRINSKNVSCLDDPAECRKSIVGYVQQLKQTHTMLWVPLFKIITVYTTQPRARCEAVIHRCSSAEKKESTVWMMSSCRRGVGKCLFYTRSQKWAKWQRPQEAGLSTHLLENSTNGKSSSYNF